MYFGCTLVILADLVRFGYKYTYLKLLTKNYAFLSWGCMTKLYDLSTNNGEKTAAVRTQRYVDISANLAILLDRHKRSSDSLLTPDISLHVCRAWSHRGPSRFHSFLL